MTTLLIATSNPGKVKELAALLAGLNCRLIGLADLPETPPVVEETGMTFAENAVIKANYYHSLTGLPTLADDSGLEVDALGGRPGVYSARYGGEGLTSAEQIELLLDEMKDIPDQQRTARFVCAIVLTGLLKISQLFEGQCEGRIARQPVGDGGFGYDPIFIDEQSGRTFAELSPEEKSARSHRGQALQKVREFLAEML
ncbi:MAG TPA: XTP/dITP diphosphatase [Blastocatellia bacterium]|nr:XTP/dITP diphosphatase [Blastocatellia bacterium]HMX25517.1 XTP/dITP diphosphatase [Blastocatellia bacterium]HMY71625.1 XTP/dITP diphosphatase [Blastocatellia bacterium]HMZ21048.1 XTP/dITP diphosphatase [Blastocatellia bacterium]HNG31480.1 XTP/dITP diphosphatase [Blastocatellia bacterium]